MCRIVIRSYFSWSYRKGKWSSRFIRDGKNPGYELDLALLSMGAYLFVVKAEGYVDRFLKEKVMKTK